MTSDTELGANPTFEMVIDAPVRVMVSPEGELTLTYYASVGEHAHSVITHLRFTRAASGGFVAGLVQLVQQGLLTLVEEDAPALQ